MLAILLYALSALSLRGAALWRPVAEVWRVRSGPAGIAAGTHSHYAGVFWALLLESTYCSGMPSRTFTATGWPLNCAAEHPFAECLHNGIAHAMITGTAEHSLLLRRSEASSDNGKKGTSEGSLVLRLPRR